VNLTCTRSLIGRWQFFNQVLFLRKQNHLKKPFKSQFHEIITTGNVLSVVKYARCAVFVLFFVVFVVLKLLLNTRPQALSA